MKILKGLPILILGIGITFLAIGISWAIDDFVFIRTAISASGTIIGDVARAEEVEDSEHNKHTEIYHYLQVRFQTRTGQPVTFVSNIGTGEPHAIGGSVNVLYKASDPADASIDDGTIWIFPGVFGLVGAILTPWPIIYFIRQRRRKELRNWLRNNGIRIQTDFTRVETNPDVSVNGAHPYRVVSRFFNPKTNRMFLFTSDDIWFDPHKYAEGRAIDVIVDSGDFSQYFVDTNFLPQTAEPARHESLKERLISWGKSKTDWLWERWKKLRDASLDRRIYLFFTLCMWGLLWLNGSLNLQLQLLFCGVLVFGLMQIALWRRFSCGWQWRSARDGQDLSMHLAAKQVWRWIADHTDMSWEVNFQGGHRTVHSSRAGVLVAISCIAALLIVAMILMPITQPAFLAWYLWGVGSAAYVVLRALGLAAGSKAEFRDACSAHLSAAAEARWKRISRTAYKVVFCAVWLLCLVLFFLSGIVGMGRDSALVRFIHVPLLADHSWWISKFFLHSHLVVQLRTTFVISFTCLAVGVLIPHYAIEMRTASSRID